MNPGENNLIVPNAQVDMQRSMHTMYPQIGDELDGAINTLRKLKQLAGANNAPQHEHGAISNNRDAPPDATLIGTAEDTGNGETFIGESVAPKADKVPLMGVNDNFGRYRITRNLGQGAMGAVYLAYDPQLERYVALKTPFLGKGSNIIDRFYREARAVASIRSPYLCPVYDIDQISGIHYISMAFIEGRPLTNAIADKEFRKPLNVASITARIARGLQKAHESGVIHRDLKPDNIMMDNDGNPVIMDFGLARRIEEGAKLTTPGMLMGSPAYMSPEQVVGDQSLIGPASDIYSLGIVIYEMLTGKVPFQGSILAVLQQIANKDPDPPSVSCPEIGEESPIERICLKMMSKAIKDRHATVAEAAEELESCFQVAAAPPPPKLSCWQRALVFFSGRP